MSVGYEPNGMAQDADTPSEASHETKSVGETSSTERRFVSPASLEQQAKKHAHSSQDTKHWLLSFSDLKPDTRVSWHFRIDEDEYPTESPYSMLPLLTKCLQQWFTRSMAESQDRNNLSWLLQYTAEYVSLGHCRLDPTEVYDLSLTLLHICNNARQHYHIEGSLAVFLAIAELGQFPQKCLEEVLNILSSAIIILDRPPQQIGACVRILASGSLSRETIACFYSELWTVQRTQDGGVLRTDNDIIRVLQAARGATRHLATLLETSDHDGNNIVDLRQLLSAVQETSEAHILRLATDLLNMLTQLLRSSRVQELLSTQGLVPQLLDIFGICRASKTIPDLKDNNSGKTKPLKEDLPKRERRYKNDHDLSLRSFLGALARILQLMSTDDARRSWRLIGHNLERLPAEWRVPALKYVTEQDLCMPGSHHLWHRDLMNLIDKAVVVQHDEIDAQVEEELLSMHSWHQDPIQNRITFLLEQRIDILRYCFRSLRAVAGKNGKSIGDAQSTNSATETGITSLKKLLQMLRVESNDDVMQALLSEIVELAAVGSAEGENPFTHVIIQTLQDDILHYVVSTEGSDHAQIDRTKAIRAIFLKSIDSPTDAARLSYQALLKIANCKTCKSKRSRLAAMRVLFRIRCDTSGNIYIDTSSDSAYMASALCRTDESLRAMFSEREAETKEASHDTQMDLQAASASQLWMYPLETTCLDSLVIPETSVIRVYGSDTASLNRDLDISDWLWLIASNLQEDKEWETYSYIIVHLGSQLVNTTLFEHSHESLAWMRGLLCGRVRERDSMFKPPENIGLNRADIALCFYHILMRLIPYYRMQSPNMPESGRKGIDLVRAFRTGIDKDYEGTARSCIHALSICCLETPEAIGSEYPAIVEVLSRNISRPHLMVHILEFLAQVARLPHLHKHFMEAEIDRIFAICCSALKTLRQSDEQKHVGTIAQKRASGLTRLQTPYRSAMLKEKGMPTYSCALAYHTMIFWFLSIPIGLRQKQVEKVLTQLTFEDAAGNQTIDQQTIVMIDMMQRVAYSDLPETARDESFTGEDYETTSYIDGNSIVTIETHKTNGRSQITKRQASGTTFAVYEPRIQPLLPHHDRAFFDQPALRNFHDRVTPSHTLLNMIGSATPIAPSEQPLKLNPNEEYVARSLRMIDLKSSVDSHKIAVTLLKDGQTQEVEYLANTTGTPEFEALLSSLGTRVSLQQPTPFVSFGLLEEFDGKETVAWRDRIMEIVYEISTLMPNVEEDKYQARKKSHMGNCLVLIIFNQSNQPWKWQYFQSQVTLVNIVVTPANRVSREESSNDSEHDYYLVEVLTEKEHQNISAAAETKVVSKATLAPFVRMLALNANIFSECVRNERAGDSEFPSSWRYRLQEMIKLRERTEQRSSDNEDKLSKRYDFSRWT